MVVEAVQAVDVQGNGGRLGEALEAMGHHFAAELAEELALEAEVDDSVRAVREVDDGAGEGLVEGRVGVSEAGDADEGAECLFVGISEGDAYVFGGVVVIDLEIFMLVFFFLQINTCMYVCMNKFNTDFFSLN